MLSSCTWSGVHLQYATDSAVFIMVTADTAFEIIGISMFLYCFLVTRLRDRTAQYQKYQILRILLMFLGLCCVLESVNTLFTNNWCVLIITTAKDSVCGIVAAIAILQIGILLHRYFVSTHHIVH